MQPVRVLWLEEQLVRSPTGMPAKESNRSVVGEHPTGASLLVEEAVGQKPNRCDHKVVQSVGHRLVQKVEEDEALFMVSLSF